MSTDTTKRRKCIAINTKVAMINSLDKGEKSNAQMCSNFELVLINVYTILKEKGMILSAISLSSEQYTLLYSPLWE